MTLKYRFIVMLTLPSLDEVRHLLDVEWNLRSLDSVTHLHAYEQILVLSNHLTP